MASRTIYFLLPVIGGIYDHYTAANLHGIDLKTAMAATDTAIKQQLEAAKALGA